MSFGNIRYYRGLFALIGSLLIMTGFQNCTGFGNASSGSTTNSSLGNASPLTLTLTSTSVSPTANSQIPVNVILSEPVVGFSFSQLNIVNATGSNLTGSGIYYSFILTATAAGTVSVQAPAGALSDARGNTNMASNLLSLTYQPNNICALLTGLAGPTNLGPRFSQTAYNIWSQMLDTSLVRDDLIVNPTAQTPAVTRSFPMPFLDNGSGQCVQMTAQVQQPQPQPAPYDLSVTVPCPAQTQNPFADQTAVVAAYINQLAAFQSGFSSNPTSIELNFVPNCSYYFISSSSKDPSFINLPALNNFTMNGGTSLNDAALLIFANPTALDSSSYSSSISIYPQANPGPSSYFQSAMSAKGGTRMQISNLKFNYMTPIISSSGVTQWNVNLPLNDYGFLSADPSAPGHYMITVNPNRPGNLTYYNMAVREIIAAEPTSPQDFAYSQLAPRAEGSTKWTYTASTSGALVIHSNSFDAFATFVNDNPSGAPVRIVHTDPNPAAGGTQFAFGDGPSAPLIDLSFINTQLGHSPGIAFGFGMTRGLLLENFNILPLDGSKDGNIAGGVIVGMINSDLIMENSNISFTGDDPVNIRSTADGVTAVGPDGTVTFAGEFGVAVGDSICFVTPVFEPTLCTQIASVSGKTFTVTSADVQTLIANVEVNDVFFRSDRPGMREYISGNTIEGGAGRLQFKGTDALIENNTLIHNKAGSIRIAPGSAGTSAGGEGALPRNVVVTNNTINLSGSSGLEGSLVLGVGLAGSDGDTKSLSPSQVIRNILIQGNSLGNEIEPAILTASAASFLVTPDNTYGTVNMTAYSQGAWWQTTSSIFPQPLTPICELSVPAN